MVAAFAAVPATASATPRAVCGSDVGVVCYSHQAGQYCLVFVAVPPDDYICL